MCHTHLSDKDIKYTLNSFDMAIIQISPLKPLLIICIIMLLSGPNPSQSAKIFTIVNYCKETIWPAMTEGENFTGAGFSLKPGQSAVYTAPPRWHGRIWGRTGCDFDQTGQGKCQTGGCGTRLNCTSPGVPPASIAEFTLGETDYYDVSLVDGFNLPIVVKPSSGGKGNCSAVGCEGDLRRSCPPDLQEKAGGKVVACRSACEVFGSDEYCCRGVYGNPVTCLPTNYSRSFKEFCPKAYSFAYDDPTSIITCSDADYTVTFCGSWNQTMCSYHNNKLSCSSSDISGSNTLTSLFCQKWWPILLLPFLFIPLHTILLYH